MPIQGYTPNKNLVKIAQNSTDNWDVWQNQNLDALDEPVLAYNSAAAETLSAGSVAVIKDDGAGAKKAYLAIAAVYVLGDPLAIVMESAQSGAPVRLALEGRAQNGAWSFGPSDKFVYLSNTGTVTVTPTAVKIGYVLSATAIYFIIPKVVGGQTDTVAGANGIQNTGNNVNAVIAPVYGSAANTVCQGNDARLHNQNTDAGTAAAAFEINYTANSARLLTTGLTANRDYTLPDGTTKLVGESVPATVIAQHSFSPASAQAPFVLGANAQGQAVTGLNADQLDGNHATAFATSGHNHDATYAPIAKGVTNGDSHDHNGGDGAAISLTAAVTGVLPLANGGTGQITANAALNSLLPAQTSNSGKVLQTDGSNTSWAAPGSSLPSQSGAKGKVLLSDGTNASWVSLRRKNGLRNGVGNVANRVTGTDAIKNASASTYVFGSCDGFTGAWTGTACTAGSLLQDTSSAVGRTGFAHHFSGVTLTGSGTLRHRQRLLSVDSKFCKNQPVSFQVSVLHDVGSNVNFTLYIRKANSADNFGAVTEIGNSGSISVASASNTLLTFENVSMGDCSNGIEIEVVAAVGAITAKNLRLTEYQLEVGAGITDFDYISYGIDDFLCRRYHEEIVMPNGGSMLGGGYFQGANVARFTAPCAPKAKAPTLTFSGPLQIMYLTGSTYDVTGVADVRHAGSFTSFYAYGATSPLTAGQSGCLYANAGEARLKLTCEP